MSAALLMAFQALAANKLRSALTMLGTVIGVTCVVALWNIGESGRRYMSGAVSAIGQNLIMVRARYDAEDHGHKPESFRPLQQREYEAVRNHCPSLEAVSPVVFISADVICGAQRKRSTVLGCSQAYVSIRGWQLSSGRPFSPADVQVSNRLALLGDAVARELFGNLDPLGQTIRLNQAPFTVAGVLEAKGTLFGQNQDDVVLIPHTAAADHLGSGRDFPMLFASARERDLIPRAKQEVRMALRESQGRLEGKRDAFLVEDLGEMAATVDNVLLGISLLLGAIGAISLLVGGIGIMNIMLVSVTERTREIGLRMAVGATGGDVLAQFLVEASVLSCTGGLVGMALGAGVAVAASKVLTALSGLDWPAVVSPGSLLLAFCFSVGVGVFFGFYPAWRASRMDPIEALRHE